MLQGDAVGLACVAGGIVRNIPPRRNPSHLMAVFDVLEETQPQGPSQIVDGVARAGGDDLAAGARRHHLGPVRRAGGVACRASSTCRFRKHDAAVFHLLDPQEIAFDFRRPMRFLDMEGGPSIFAEPNEIAERYQKAIGGYLDELLQVVRESAVDYHRVSIDENYEQLLIRFLVGRTRVRGRR